ncbi:immunity protein [Pseudomonas syringae]|uniref:Immunity protein n=1 Tax=Pseudomonas syringae TaxID=317 RepID=A0A085VQP0_PSESX|nr:immunity protein [Pseudomonas syringae]
MSIVEQIVKNESVEDVLTLFALNKGLPSLDMMFSRYRREVIISGEFLRVYRRLFDEGVLAPGDNIIAAKGPNWKEPKFLSDKRYAV